jgi:hypothetical protein
VVKRTLVASLCSVFVFTALSSSDILNWKTIAVIDGTQGTNPALFGSGEYSRKSQRTSRQIGGSMWQWHSRLCRG